MGRGHHDPHLSDGDDGDDAISEGELNRIIDLARQAGGPVYFAYGPGEDEQLHPPNPGE